MSKRLLLVLNPTSGKRAGKRHLADVVDRFCRADYIPTVFVTASRGDARRIVRTHGGEADLVVCLGGDGTFNEVVSGLLEGGHTTPIGYIPCGSTNDFASAIGLDKAITTAITAVLEGEPHTYDVGQFGDRYFSYVASFGIFSRTSYATPQNVKNTFGHLAYVLEGIKDMTNIVPHRVRVETDDNVYEGEYIFGSVTNTTSVGGIVKFDKELVKMNDGLFEIVLVKNPANINELSKIIVGCTNSNFSDSVFEFIKTRKVKMTFESDMDWSVDGEHERTGKEIEIENLMQAATIIGR